MPDALTVIVHDCHMCVCKAVAAAARLNNEDEATTTLMLALE